MTTLKTFALSALIVGAIHAPFFIIAYFLQLP
jgi:hypothetical protein